VLIGEIKDAVNIPAEQIMDQLERIPKDTPVILICYVGMASEQAAGKLAALGYRVTHVDGGYKAYSKLIPAPDEDDEDDDSPETPPSPAAEAESEPLRIDAKGLKCPGPIVKVADFLRDKPEGTRIRVEATEDAFYSDIRIWCERTGNQLDSLSAEDGVIHAEITRRMAQQRQAAPQAEKNDKTFVVFSGDLDKTIAAFIMANGAAAMGRKVTMFFTFWGLNILRRPEKVSASKNFIEKMFGVMMPRGTKKLGLSRMNMGGAGAKMIRWIMREKGISSLEELIDSAKAHGVRIVACQMSMDIMGIRQEELIDGVELGGVSTFLGSGEESDMSLFI
jgi:peroxiredoxin family protein/TusA-related sulfurtransferase